LEDAHGAELLVFFGPATNERFVIYALRDAEYGFSDRMDKSSESKTDSGNSVNSVQR
jgi:hypothetical protein